MLFCLQVLILCSQVLIQLYVRYEHASIDRLASVETRWKKLCSLTFYIPFNKCSKNYFCRGDVYFYKNTYMDEKNING